MIEKDKDLFLDMLENPNLTLEDLVSVGHTADSTRFLDKSAYENSQRVRDKFMDDEGNFKLDEFNKWYSMASNAYLLITNKDTNLSLLNVTAFDESDITVSPEKRLLNTKPVISFSPNPDRLSTGVYRIGKTSERERTLSELALAEKVLLNPIEAAKDPSKAKWGDSPNDSWWGNFFDTLVLAQWDEDGEHIDPVTKEKVTHKKGELKLNDNGTYYYESLDGRDIYGRLVLNKMNTITTDGTFWNQYDFFDSDDINEKSFVGSVAKNLALVGSMFIPYVGWGVAGASVATLMIGLTGTLGKMLTGSDSPTFSAMEGWAKSFNRQTAKSEYAQQNMLCWENFIDLIGDTTALLRELRAIFKFAPAIFGKGKYGILSEHFGANEKALKALKVGELEKASAAGMDPYKLLAAAGGKDLGLAASRVAATQLNIISSIADLAVADYFKKYNKLGEQIARAYMVGITVGDTYGEAKEAGATDFEATMLTLGYAAAENKLLNSELGRWIFPELKAERVLMKQIAKALIKEPEKLTAQGVESSLISSGVKKTRAELIGKAVADAPLDIKEASKFFNKLDDNKRLAWMKKWFNKGKDIFDTLQAVMRGTMGAALSNALAEGTEEVSEELLKDFSTSCFNLVKAAQGNNDVRMQGFLGEWDWNEALKRYGMSFFGGVIGGGINSAATDYSQFKDMANMTSEKAMQLLVWMDRNGEIDKFWDVINKETLGDKYHTTELNEDGTYKLGDSLNNQDIEIKKAIRSLLNLIHNILTSNGASLDDLGLINLVMLAVPGADKTKILGDFRAQALSTSVTAGRFLKEYNTLCKAIVIELLKLNNLQKQTIDSKEPSPDLLKAIKESEKALKILLDSKDKLLKGERTAEFYKDALFETTYGVSESFIAPTEVQFMERETGKAYSLISEDERKELKKKYADWSTTERAELVHLLAEIFYNAEQKTSLALLLSSEMFQKMKEGLLNNLAFISSMANKKLGAMFEILSNPELDSISEIDQLLRNINLIKDQRDYNPLGLYAERVTNELTPGEVVLSDFQRELLGEDESYINKLKAAIENAGDSDSLKISNTANVFFEEIVSKIDNMAQEIFAAGYVHPEVKALFKDTLQLTRTYISDLYEVISNNEGDTELEEKALKYDDILENYINTLESMNNTPIMDNLKNYAIGLGTDDTVLSLVLQAINKETNNLGAIDNILLDDIDALKFDEAEKLLKLYRATIVAARTDNTDVDSIFGYNKTLNELLGTTENWELLAEIDKDTAELALIDINLALKRLGIIRDISEANAGNKLNTLHKVSANKNLIIHNKLNKLITTLLNEKDDSEVKREWNKDGALDDLKLALEKMSVHRNLNAEKASDRKLSLNIDEKRELEKELHIIGDAIYEFFQKNSDKLTNTLDAREKLINLLKTLKLDFYDKNEDLLTESSDTIDDGAFFWWLASKAALKTSDFYKVYKDVIKDDIAPIPTLELGIYAGIAAIYNGDVFTSFGDAMRQFIREDWESRDDVIFDESGKLPVKDLPAGGKYEIMKQKGLLGGELPFTNKQIDSVLFSDLVPSFTNILFIEGIPGSGKSTGVFKTIAAILNKTKESHHLFNLPIVISHATNENAEDLAKSLEFETDNIKSFGKEELLKWISSEYRSKLDPNTGKYIYYMDLDCVIGTDGNIHSTWKINTKRPEEVPSILFIDEWSRYTLPEIDLINRFASEYGVLVIAGGDLDLLSPTGYLLKNSDSKITDEDTLLVSSARNLTPRIAKLGISMRTGNGQKNYNLALLQAWKKSHSTDSIPLLFVETETDLYGDKVFSLVSDDLDLTDELLQAIEKDLNKFLANIDKDTEKIGYIYHDPNTKLYKLLSQSKYKDFIDFKSEEAALGKEAKYYIVENNRSPKLDELDYHKSLYTGISRALQASIVIAPKNPIGNLRVILPKKLENKLIPDNFTGPGITRFAQLRRSILSSLYENTTGDLGEVIPRTKIAVSLAKAKKPKENTGNNANPISKFAEGQILTNGEKEYKIVKIEPFFDSEDVINYSYKVQENTNIFDISELDLLSQGFTVKTEEEIKEEPKEGPKEELEGTEGEPGSTVWELTEENIRKVADAIKEAAVNTGTEIVFKISTVEQICGANSGDLLNIIARMIDEEIIESTAGIGVYKIVANPESETLEPEIPELKYRIGDWFELSSPKIGQYKIEKAEWDDSLKNWVYTLNLNNTLVTKTLTELNSLELDGKYTSIEDWVDPQTGFMLPELLELSRGAKTFEKLVEEDLEKSEEAIEEGGELKDGDILFKLLGYSFNTNYLGIPLTDDGTIDRKKLIKGRIDNANGLLKLNPNLTAQECRNFLGMLRLVIMTGTESEIKNTLMRKFAELKDKELQINWKFISKSPKPNSKFSEVYYYDANLPLDNANGEIPTKTISLTVSYKGGNDFLEIPLMTLSSPFSTLYKISQKYPENPISKAYIEAIKEERRLPYYEVLNEVINAIENSNECKDSKGKLKHGYKKLRNLCKLWVFQGNGVRGITIHKGDAEDSGFKPKDLNLGQKYVKNRITKQTIGGKTNPNDSKSTWTDLVNEMGRTDVLYSRIMIAINSYDNNNHRIIEAGHPFILRSISPDIESTEEMMQQYLELLEDPTSPLLVLLIPISAPEISVSKYLEKRADGTNCHYGNAFSAYHILRKIYNNDKALYKEIDRSLRESSDAEMPGITEMIKTLEDVEKSINSEELNHQQLVTKICKALAKYIRDKKWGSKLSTALFLLTHDYAPEGSELKEFKRDIALKIELLCAIDDGTSVITGILYRVRCTKDIQPIAGFGYIIDTLGNIEGEVDSVKTPDGGSFRMFGKYDTPIFDLDILQGNLENWVLYIKNIPGYSNLYTFDDSIDKKHILAKEAFEGKIGTRNSNKKSENLKLKEQYSELLTKLEKDGYNLLKLDSIHDQLKFLKTLQEIIVEEHPGRVAAIVGNSIVYTDLTNEGVVSSDKFRDDFTTALLVSFEFNGTDGYTLDLKLLNGETLKINVNINTSTELLECEWGEKKITKKVVETSFGLLELLDRINSEINNLDNSVEKINTFKKYFDIISSNLDKSKEELLLLLNPSNSRFAERKLKQDLPELFLDADSVTKQEIEEELYCSIVVHKKFIK